MAAIGMNGPELWGTVSGRSRRQLRVDEQRLRHSGVVATEFRADFIPLAIYTGLPRRPFQSTTFVAHFGIAE